MPAKIIRPYFLIVLITLSAALTFFVLRPFLIVLILAGIFAISLQPLHTAISRRLKNVPSISSLATMLVAIVVILIPLLFITSQIAVDAQRLYISLSNGSGEAYLTTLVQQTNAVVAQYFPNLALSGTEISIAIDTWTKNILTWMVQNLGGLFGGISSFFADVLVFLIALYYLLRDGSKLRDIIIKTSPLADTEDSAVLSRLELAVHSVIRGSLMIALIQGVLTATGFALAGIPNSVLWGVVASFSALIPGIGTSLVLIPGVSYLFITGSIIPATGLLLWSIFAVGLIDNFLGPKLVGKGMQLHPLLVLLSVFGGLAFFGPSGVFLGPLCTSLLFALLSVYQHVSTDRAC